MIGASPSFPLRYTHMYDRLPAALPSSFSTCTVVSRAERPASAEPGALSLAPADALRDPARLGRVLALGLPNGVSSLLAECAGSFSNRLLVLTVGFGAAFAVACLIGHDALLRLFLSDPEALALGRSLLPWLLLGSPLFGVYYLGVNFLQAPGRAAATTVLSALRQGALLLPALYLLHALLGLPGLAAARAVADMLGAAIAALLFAAWRGLTWRY